jgi:glycosyltransferase involved in cell wall biosynthesis
MTPLKVSAIIPTHNRAPILARAVHSALRELEPWDELVIIDDGSSDGTESIIGSIGDSRIVYIRQTNRGAGAARNRGAAEAKGDLIAYLDSDDAWLPGKIQIQRRFMAARPDVLFCFTDFQRDYGSSRLRKSIHTWHSDPRTWEQILGRPQMFSALAELPAGVADFRVYTGDIYHGEMRNNYVLTSCIMIRRREAGDATHFAEGVRTFEDWECFGRLAQRGTAAYLDIETAVQYAHGGPRLTDADLVDCAEARLTVLRNVWGNDPEFLARAGDDYRELFREQQLMRVRGLLVNGRTPEARERIRELAAVPMAYRLLAALPGALAAGLLGARRTMNELLELIPGLGSRTSLEVTQ